MLPLSILLGCSFALSPVVARLLHSLTQDTYALPQYRVAFLNALPVLNDTAQRWLSDGLPGGEREFLDQPWSNESFPKEIGDGADPPSQSSFPYHSLETMKLSPHDAYLCLIPLPLDQPLTPPDDPPPDVMAVQSWSLLQPLYGTCLYHRQGWFTYSYCHNEQIRQFRELPHAHPHPSGYKPEEDPEWEAYTLGRAPPTPEPGADLTVAQQNALAANLELARGAGSRYLVQRWTDGTVCDKTGRSREVEVQFHCSPTMTDNILFVKEAKLCSYVLVIHTPRLCGQPGFKSRGVDASDVALIRCRQIVDSPPDPSLLHSSDVSPLRETDTPLTSTRRRRASPPDGDAASPPNDENMAEDASSGEQPTRQDRYNDLIRTLSILMNGKVDGQMIQIGDNGEFVIEIVDDRIVNAPNADRDGAAAASGGVEEGEPIDSDAARAEAENVLAEVLRAARLGPRQPEETPAADSKSHPKKTEEDAADKRRDEL